MKRFEAAGWAATRIDGHDPDAIAAALAHAQQSDRPNLIACRTTIGFGAPTKAGTEKVHGSALGADEVAGAREVLNWPYAPFEIPPDVQKAWHDAGRRSQGARAAYGSSALQRFQAIDAPSSSASCVATCRTRSSPMRCSASNKKTSRRRRRLRRARPPEQALEVLTQALPEMVGGSADLTGSNNTRPKGISAFSAANPAGRFIHYGVREHAMASAMNGMALHGGVIPYSGTFLVFSDYCRAGDPARRPDASARHPRDDA